MPTNQPLPSYLIRQIAEQALSRSAGAPLVLENQVTLLYNSSENFPAWERAIQAAHESIFIEMYIFANDPVGQKIRQLLLNRLKAGVTVYLLYDWLGSLKSRLSGFFKPLLMAGAQIRAYNPPSLGSPLKFLGRNHRKQIIIDRRTVFISGLCISASWEGSARIAPWRDTGVKIDGPLAHDALSAFADSWGVSGSPLDTYWLTPINHPSKGLIAARLIATTPATAQMMRIDLLVASFARCTLWLTDAYFMATSLYLSALKQAALDGVDVRLLVPRSSDIGWIATLSRTQYRPLLESGVRVFEWNGPMIHAKTAVADGRWARIGSTNLNLSSWLANREIDVAIEDESLAQELANKFLQDLENATEVVLSADNRRLGLSKPRHKNYSGLFLPAQTAAITGASAAARQAARIGDALDVVVRGTRPVDASEALSFLTIGLTLLILAVIIGFFPWLIAAPLIVILFFTGGAIILRALSLYRTRKSAKKDQKNSETSSK